MSLKNIENTKELFKQIVEQHKNAGKESNRAGKLFEDFNMIALPNYVRSDIVGIWDTNEHKNIPDRVVKDLFGNDWKLLKQVLSGASYGIDKIIELVDGTYGFVSDKSTNKDKLSKEKIDGLFSLYPKLQHTVSEWIICSNAKDVPARVKGITSGIVTYILYDDYVPNKKDEIAKQKEKNLWKIIHGSIDAKKKPKIKGTFNFKYRNNLQKQYVDPPVKYAIDSFNAGNTEVKQWGDASMGVGKSLLDQVIKCKVQSKCWSPELTNTNAPVNINIFDSRRNASQNGLRALDVTNQFYGPVKSIWITQADISMVKDNTNIPNKQTMDVNKIVKIIRDCNKKGLAVEIMILIHHIEILQKVEKDLKAHIDGFRFWNYNHDEYDLLATTDRAGKRMGWFYIDACHRYGSTGTPVVTLKSNLITSPKDNPRMDNLLFYGPKTSFVSVTMAQKAKLIPPLVTIMVGVRLSEIANLPNIPIKPKKGVPILQTPVNGFDTIYWNGKERYMNVGELARFYGVVKAFCHRPETFLNKACVGFSNFQAEAQLFRKNFKPLVDHIEGKTAIGRKLSRLLIMLLNEDKDDAINDRKIKRLFSEKEAIIMSQRLLGRGIDYQFRTGFHIVLKETRQMLQEIFRLMRLDDTIPYELQTRYHICPVLINDIVEDEPTVDEKFLDTLDRILEHNESAKTELALQWKSGQSGGGGGVGGQKSFDAIDLDFNDLDGLVKGMAARSATGGFLATAMEQLHTKIFNEMIKLPIPTNPHEQSKILKSYVNDKDFKEIETLSGRSPKDYVKSIWRGEGKCQQSDIIRQQVQRWQDFVQNYIDKRNAILENILPYIRKLCEKEGVNTDKIPTKVTEIVRSRLKSMGFKQVLKTNTVSDVIKGRHHYLSKKSQKIQSAWYEASVLDKGLTQRQAFLDEVTEKFNLMDRYMVQEIAKKHGIRKKEATTICFHPRVYPCADSNPHSRRFKGIDRTKWNEKVEQQLAYWFAVGKRTVEVYQNFYDNFPFYYPGQTNVARGDQVSTMLKDEFGIELDPDTIRKIVGPFDEMSKSAKNKTTRSERFASLENTVTRWTDLNPDPKKTNEWFANTNKKVKNTRKKIFDIAWGEGNNPARAQKKFPNWNLKEDFLKGLKKEF